MLDKLKFLLGITNADQDVLLELLLDSTMDKVMIYTRQENLPKQAQGLVVEMAADAYHLLKKSQDGGAGEITGSISTLSDNGQSVSYRESAYTAILASVSDEFFKNYTLLLERFRKVGW